MILKKVKMLNHHQLNNLISTTNQNYINLKTINRKRIILILQKKIILMKIKVQLEIEKNNNSKEI